MSIINNSLITLVLCILINNSNAQTLKVSLRAKQSDYLLVTAKFWRGDSIITTYKQHYYRGTYYRNEIHIDFNNNYDSLKDLKIYLSQLNKSNFICIKYIFYEESNNKIEICGSDILKYFEYNKFLSVNTSNKTETCFNSYVLNNKNNSYLHSSRKKLFGNSNLFMKNTLNVKLQCSDTLTVILFYDDISPKLYNNSFAFDFNKVYSKLYVPTHDELSWEWYTLDTLKSFKIAFVNTNSDVQLNFVKISGITIYTNDRFVFTGSKQILKHFYISEEINLMPNNKDFIFYINKSKNPYSSFIASNSLTFIKTGRIYENIISFSLRSKDTLVVKLLGSEDRKNSVEYPKYDYTLAKSIKIFPANKFIIKETMFSKSPLREFRFVFIIKKDTHVFLDSIKLQTENNTYFIEKGKFKKLLKPNVSLSFANNGKVLLHPKNKINPMFETWGLTSNYFFYEYKSYIGSGFLIMFIILFFVTRKIIVLAVLAP